MLTEISAFLNLGIGCIWFVGQSWFWMMAGGVGGIHYSIKGFMVYSGFLLLLLAGPSCLIVGSWKTLKSQSTAVSTLLNFVGLFEMAYFLVPVVYDALHPAPLEYVDVRFTVIIAVILLLTFLSSCCLALQFLHHQKQMKKVMLDAA